MEFTPSKVTYFSFLKKATKVHERKKPFKCDLCSAEFTDEINLTDHVSTKHERKRNKLK